MKYYVENYNWEGIKFPASESGIQKFEKNNLDVVVNVLFDDCSTICQWHISKHGMERAKQANLLLVKEGDKTHYTVIKSMSALMRDKSHQTEQYCMNCLRSFTTVEERDKHFLDCKENAACRIGMPCRLGPNKDTRGAV